MELNSQLGCERPRLRVEPAMGVDVLTIQEWHSDCSSEGQPRSVVILTGRRHSLPLDGDTLGPRSPRTDPFFRAMTPVSDRGVRCGAV